MVRTVGTVRTVGLPSLSLHSLSYLPGQAGVRGLEVPVREGEGRRLPPVLNHPLALGTQQVVFLPPQCIGIKPERQAVVQRGYLGKKGRSSRVS